MSILDYYLSVEDLIGFRQYKMRELFVVIFPELSVVMKKAINKINRPIFYNYHSTLNYKKYCQLQS